MSDEPRSRWLLYIPFSAWSLNQAYPTNHAGVRYNPPECVQYRASIRRCLELQCPEGIKIPKNAMVDCQYSFFFLREELWTQDGKPQRKDLSNLFKAIEDAVFDWLGVDDSSVFRIVGEKYAVSPELVKQLLVKPTRWTLSQDQPGAVVIRIKLLSVEDLVSHPSVLDELFLAHPITTAQMPWFQESREILGAAEAIAVNRKLGEHGSAVRIMWDRKLRNGMASAAFAKIRAGCGWAKYALHYCVQGLGVPVVEPLIAQLDVNDEDEMQKLILEFIRSKLAS